MSWSMFAIGWLDLECKEMADIYFMRNLQNIRNVFQVITFYMIDGNAHTEHILTIYIY